MGRLSISLPQNALLTINKCLVTSHLDCRDILYDKPNKKNFQSK